MSTWRGLRGLGKSSAVKGSRAAGGSLRQRRRFRFFFGPTCRSREPSRGTMRPRDASHHVLDDPAPWTPPNAFFRDQFAHCPWVHVSQAGEQCENGDLRLPPGTPFTPPDCSSGTSSDWPSAVGQECVCVSSVVCRARCVYGLKHTEICFLRSARSLFALGIPQEQSKTP